MFAAATALTLGDVEPYQQTERYSCGAATLKAVLKHWGEDVGEKKLIKEIGIDPKSGSTALQVAAAARARGYRAQVKQFRDLNELGSYTNRDVPVIVAMRSFTKPNQGHFLVATRVNPASVELMDPNVKGNQRTLTYREMLQRWAFRDRVGVIVTPKNRRTGLGVPGVSSSETSPSRRTIGLVIAGAVAAIAAATTGVVLYRRQRSPEWQQQRWNP